MNLTSEQLRQAAILLKAIANPTRLAVVDLLQRGRAMTVNEIGDKLACEQSLLSHHLSEMRNKELLNAEKKGVFVYYSLKEKNLLSVLKCIEKCNCVLTK